MNSLSMKLFVCAGVTIGFDESVYSVGEGAGQVVLGVSVLTGTLSSDLVVSVITMERSATGTKNMSNTN